MIAALEVARALGADVQIIDDVVASHKQYLLAIEHMFAAIDRLDSVAASRIDSGEVDPTFDKMEAQVSQASDRYGAQASDKLQSLSSRPLKKASRSGQSVIHSAAVSGRVSGAGTG